MSWASVMLNSYDGGDASAAEKSVGVVRGGDCVNPSGGEVYPQDSSGISEGFHDGHIIAVLGECGALPRWRECVS